MIKLVILARRRRDWSSERSTGWWRDHHVAFGHHIPGLLAYKHGKVVRDFDHPAPSQCEWDGFAELYFADEQALDRAFASEEWRDAVRDVSGTGSDRIALIMDEIDLLGGTEPAAGPSCTVVPARRPSSVLESFDLTGRTALVTGGHGALAEAMGAALAQLGCNVVLGARKEGLCVGLAELLHTKYGVGTLGLRCDVTNEGEVERTVQATADKFGSLDILLTNAGAFWAGAVEEIPLKGWQKAVDVNINGTFLACRAAGRQMVRQQRGSIINIASSAGLMSFPPEVLEVVPYTTTKAAVIKLTRDLAVAWARHGIRVNAIAPGQLESGVTGSIDVRRQAALRARMPLGRFGKPEEIGPAVAFLASDASSFVTGHTLVVDGGQTIG